MIETEISENKVGQKKRPVPDLSTLTSDQPAEAVLTKAQEYKEFLKGGGLSSKDATAQVNRLLELKGVAVKLSDQTEKLS